MADGMRQFFYLLSLFHPTHHHKPHSKYLAVIMGILEKIADIEKEMSKTQKNKATEYHLGLLKAKLAKYRTMLLEPTGKAGPKGEGFDVVRSL
jgi:hypothetical protein